MSNERESVRATVMNLESFASGPESMVLCYDETETVFFGKHFTTTSPLKRYLGRDTDN